MSRWSQCFTALADPGLNLPRFGHTAVAVEGGGAGSDLLVVFGGVGAQAAGDAAQVALGDVLALQVDSGTWFAPDVLAAPGSGGSSSSGPGARAFHCAAALPGRASLLVFGGHILTLEGEAAPAAAARKRRHFLNDVWLLDTREWQWRLLAAPGDAAGTISPPKRDMAALLLVEDQHSLLLFGGRSESGRAMNDTWLFDIDTASWQQLRPEGPLPPPRKMHSMAKLGSQVVLFGGERDNGPLDDLWLLRGFGGGEPLRWTHLKIRAAPAPRFGHAMVTLPAAAAAAMAGAAGSSSGRGMAAAASSGSIGAGSNASSDAAAGVEGGVEGGDSAAPAAAGGGLVAAASPRQSSSGGAAASGGGAAAGEVVLLFGGCLDLSSFLSLTRNYVQSRETWLLDLTQLSWTQLTPPAGDAGAAAGPCERMCHSLSRLPDGRLLLVGGRHKDGICKDQWWWLDQPAEEQPVPASPAPSVSPRASSAAPAGVPPAGRLPAPHNAADAGQQPAAALAAPARPGSQSLLQSLLNPIRGRDASQGQLAAAPGAAGGGTTSSSTPQTLSQPDSPLPPPPTQQQQLAQQQQQPDLLSVVGTAAAAQRGGPAAHRQQPPPPPPPAAWPPPQQQPDPASASAQFMPGSSSSSGQPLAALMDVGSEQLKQLIRNPAAYSADALTRISSSVSSTVTSLLGAEGQPGALPRAIPAALSKVAPGLLVAGSGAGRTSGSGSSSWQQQSQPQQQPLPLAAPGMLHPGLAAIRAEMGLDAAGRAAAAAALPVFTSPGDVLQQLVVLGQQLLGEDAGPAAAAAALGSSSGQALVSQSGLPADVLVSAARQHLMSSAVGELRLPQVALLLADYQQLAVEHHGQQMLSRLADGFAAAAASSTGGDGSFFLQRLPRELLHCQVELLQSEYKHMLTEAAA